MTTAQRWRLRGEYFENCNCDVICPCIFSNIQAPPTRGHCDAVLAFNIQDGSYGNISLNGLSYIIVLYTPGPMAQGNAKLALYIDERANGQQREALGTILGGQAGGMPAMLPDLIPISEMLGVKYVPISFRIDGNERRLEVPDIVSMNIAGIEGLPGQTIFLDNVMHPAGSRLALARGQRTIYKDYDFNWDNSGQNAHHAPFEWSGP